MARKIYAKKKCVCGKIFSANNIARHRRPDRCPVAKKTVVQQICIEHSYTAQRFNTQTVIQHKDERRIVHENAMKLFEHITDNIYWAERVICETFKTLTCDCSLPYSEIENNAVSCGEECINWFLMVECGPKCVFGECCSNRRIQKHQNVNCTIINTKKKGYGLSASSYIAAGQFIMEYVGEVLNIVQFRRRVERYTKQMNVHSYFMTLGVYVIDATKKGNFSRFINHSCDPNAEIQKWMVNGELRIGIFSLRPIMPNEEITFNYNFQRYGKERQECHCEAKNCRNWIDLGPETITK